MQNVFDPPSRSPSVRKAFTLIEGSAESQTIDDDLEQAIAILTDAAELDPAQVARLAQQAVGELDHSAVSLVHQDLLSCLVIGDDGVAYADQTLCEAFGPVTDWGVSPEALSKLHHRTGKRRSFEVLRLGSGRALGIALIRGELAGSWPLSAGARAALSRFKSVTAGLVVFPQEARQFQSLLQSALSLTPAEAVVTAALFESSNTGEIASRLGTTETMVRERIRSIMRKTGLKRRAEILAQFTDLLAGDYTRAHSRVALLQDALKLTKAEARVVDGVSRGMTVSEIGKDRGVSSHTVRAQLDSAMERTGIRHGADLARVAAECSALAAWTGSKEADRQLQGELIQATRFIRTPKGRRIAAASFGAPTGRPVLYLHPGYCYRLVRRALRDALAERGFRTISFDRAGCGLSDEATDMHPFDQAASDAETVLKAFGLGKVSIFAEYGSSAAAIALAARCPDRIGEVVMLMPRPSGQTHILPQAVQHFQDSILAKPGVGDSLWEVLRLLGGTRFWTWVQMQITKDSPADRAAMTEPGFMHERVSEMSASNSRTMRGTALWERAHLVGWPRPSQVGGSRWTIVETSVNPFKTQETVQELWGWLPNVRFVTFGDAGRIATHTHATEVADLFS